MPITRIGDIRSTSKDKQTAANAVRPNTQQRRQQFVPSSPGLSSPAESVNVRLRTRKANHTMNDSQEAMARVAIANFEARQLEEEAVQRSRRWRFASILSQIVVLLGLSVYVQVAHWQISGAQACGFFLIYVAGTAWGNYHVAEKIHSLQKELERTRAELKEKSA